MNLYCETIMKNFEEEYEKWKSLNPSKVANYVFWSDKMSQVIGWMGTNPPLLQLTQQYEVLCECTYRYNAVAKEY